MNKALIYLTLGTLALTACDQTEDPIQPSGDYSVIRFDFPQGDNDFDMDIKEIHDVYGVYLIYKDVTLADINRRWTSLGTGNLYNGDAVPDEYVPFYVNFFKNHIFSNISPEIAYNALPIKIYMLENWAIYDPNKTDEETPGTGTGTGTTGTGTGTSGTGTGTSGTGTGTSGTSTGTSGTGTGTSGTGTGTSGTGTGTSGTGTGTSGTGTGTSGTGTGTSGTGTGTSGTGTGTSGTGTSKPGTGTGTSGTGTGTSGTGTGTSGTGTGTSGTGTGTSGTGTGTSGTGTGTSKPGTGTGTSGTGTGTSGTGTGTSGTGTGTGTTTQTKNIVTTVTNGFDYWAISFTRDGIQANDKESLRVARCSFLYQMIKKAFEDGLIKEPTAIREKLDLKTAYKNTTGDPNHFLNRGIPYFLYENFIGSASGRQPAEDKTVSFYVTEVSNPTATKFYFLLYVRTAMFFSRAEMQKKYAAYPLTLEIYDDIVAYMKNVYGIDLEGICAGPQE